MDLQPSGVLPSTLNDTLSVKNSKKKIIGMKQIYWSYRARYITMVQTALAHPISNLRDLLRHPIPLSVFPLGTMSTCLSRWTR